MRVPKHTILWVALRASVFFFDVILHSYVSSFFQSYVAQVPHEFLSKYRNE